MNWATFFSMDARAFYMWGSFGAFVVAIMLEITLVRMRGKHAQAEIEEQLMADKAKRPAQ